ncbi:KH domain-containing protein At4g18375 [Coffea arabica]|uniref:KH domain-containing protein At4g18375 n=1 Tax=Coffea arabica TaxID=13443 RepID=A0A6P6V1D9_COFAR|nr:RNA-binding KH domain-containing protein RCF3 isoform X1 [Coffea arabica]XP_027096505.1 RNA-binding KH domain-containing protein RCF3 isoform X1 [Coffea arabica]XP_027096506.1 RNA-binding KH domain-containing protein RCF3 isoform X1 [Coffea arabica]XP_027096507.1 RNA-binding KH domain-containing protein RCF3 isoform X1 [Coffea arabica]
MAGQRNDYGKRMHSQSEYSANEGSKRRNPNEEKESNAIGPEDTVYRYLCPLRRIGSIIGVGGDIAKQLRAETHAKIRISEMIPGCEERVVTIYSSREETNSFGDDGDLISPAQDALFKVHERVVAEEVPIDDELEASQQVTVRLLVPSDQIGCVIGKGGQVVENIRNDSGAQVRILSSEHLPPCALSSDELIQIVGETYAVKKALYQVASRLHDNPSRSQHLLLSSASIYRSGSGLVNPGVGAPLISSLVGPYRGYKSAGADHSTSVKEFSLRLVCPNENVGAVIGKGGGIIKQIRQESGASIKVDTSVAEGDECMISVSAKETFEDASPTIDATMRLQPRCSEKTDKESDDPVVTTRLLVPSSRIGCLIGKGGAIINEMRSATRASIRILSEENLPKVASEDDEMVQITGDLNVASTALLQVLLRLRANLFEMEGALAAFPPAVPYVPLSMDAADGPKHGNRDHKSHNHGYSTYSGGYDSKNLVQQSESYGVYGSPQIGGRSGGYGAYGIYSGRSSGGSGLSSHNPGSHGKSYGH